MPLATRASTPERLSLLGGAYKRLAWVREGAMAHAAKQAARAATTQEAA